MAKRYGNGQAFFYGVGGTVASCAVQSFKLGSEAKNKAEVGDEIGNEIERYKDDIHDEATIELKYRQSYAIPTATATVVYEGATWEVEKVERAETNKGHRIVTLSIKKSQYINSSTSSGS